MEKLFDKFFLNFDKFVHLIGTLLDAFFHAHKKIFNTLSKFVFIVIEAYKEFTKRIYTFFRWSTIPINFIIVRVSWLWYIFRFEDFDPLRKKGVHYIRALPRGGKSLLAYQLANTIMDETGYSSYMTSQIEKPRLTKNGTHYYVNHQVIDLKSYYGKGTKLKRFNTDKFKSMFIDEFHVLNNARLNSTKENKEFFIPFINDLVLLAHLGFDNNIYLLSQVPSNDVQIMSILAGYHEIFLKKGISYWLFIKFGTLKVIPLKIKVKHYTVEWDHNGNSKRKLFRTTNRKVDIDRLEFFDTLAERDRDKHLPLDFK